MADLMRLMFPTAKLSDTAARLAYSIMTNAGLQRGERAQVKVGELQVLTYTKGKPARAMVAEALSQLHEVSIRLDDGTALRVFDVAPLTDAEAADDEHQVTLGFTASYLALVTPPSSS